MMSSQPDKLAPDPLRPPAGGMLACDIAVIGAGPAGCAAARAAADAGARVAVVERRPAVGMPARCAGYIPLSLTTAMAIDADVIAQPIEKMVTHYPGGVEEIRSFGYIVHRERLDRELARSASASGALLLTGCRASSLAGNEVFIAGDPSISRIFARVIIGADGPRSTVGRQVGRVNNDFVAAAQWLVGLKQRTLDIQVYFAEDIAGGYGWLFPVGGHANVGVAVSRGAGMRPAAALRRFATDLARQGLIELPALSATGGLIPVGGPLDCLAGNVLLAGDAGGHCHPLTGAGIATAVQCGKLAGLAAAASIDCGTGAPLKEYREEVEAMVGGYLRDGVARRRELYEHQGSGMDAFAGALRRAWFAFPEYIRKND